MQTFIIQLIDRTTGDIADARTYYGEESFRKATAYDWPEKYLLRCFDVTTPSRPTRVWL